MKLIHKHSLVYVAGILFTMLVINHDTHAKTIQVLICELDLLGYEKIKLAMTQGY